MSLKDKNVVVTGGNRGLGLGLVEALVAHGARVSVVARGADALESVRARLGVATISADVTDETAAHRILAEVRPDILALNAGATPRMGRLDQLSWADFTAPWETDVKAGLYWLQAALNLPLESPKAASWWYRAARPRADRRCRAATAAPSACSSSSPSTPTVSRSRRISGSASRRSCRSRWSAAPGSATRAPTPTRAP
jgi:NAD(P)-dependent dehydrogenase (short-subunit alcohol dehydrogenase family)